MPRNCCPYREAEFQRRLWTPYLLATNQQPHIWICGCARGNTFVGSKFSAMENLAKWSSATIAQSTDANRPLADTYVNGKLCPRFVQTSGHRFDVSGATAANSSMLLLYNDTSTYNYVTPIGTGFDGTYGTWHGNDTDAALFSATYASPEARNGTTRFNGNTVNPTTTGRPDALTLVSNRCSAADNVATQMIGADSYTGQNRSITGVICELMVWVTTVPNARTIELCEGFVAWFWGKQTSLDAAHAFKNRPPLIGD